MRFINPKTDFAFKKIFGSEQSKDILISFLLVKQQSLEIAKRLIDLGLDDQTISQTTGLNLQEVQNLRVN
jgi:hypothetical protein